MKSKVLLAVLSVCLLWGSFVIAQDEPVENTAGVSINKVLLVGLYDAGGVMNMLGGLAGGDEERPGTCFPQMGFDPVEALNNSGGYLTINYDVHASGSYTFYWIKMATEKGSGETGTTLLDLSEYHYLSFWIKGANGRERFKIEVHQDSNDDGKYVAGRDVSSAIYIDRYIQKGMVETDWAKVVIPLTAFNKVSNWKNIDEIVFVFESYINVEKVSTVYIDELLFGKNYFAPDGVNKNPEITLDSVTVNDEPMKDGFVFDLKNQIKVTLKDQNLETIEALRAMIKRPNDQNWKVVGSDFANGTDIFTIKWTAIDVTEDETFSVKIISEDLYGNRLEIGPEYTNCKANSISDEAFVEALVRDAFNFFWENWHSGTGLFSDSSRNDYSSIASTGFGLTAYVIGAEKGYADKDELRMRVNKTLDTFLERAFTKSGFFYHFLNLNDAQRYGRSEVSTVDTALLLCGMIVAAEYFGEEVYEKVEKIYSNIVWSDFIFTDDEENPNFDMFYMGWLPDGSTNGKFLDAYWNYYSDEVTIIALLAIGSPTNPVDAKYFYNWAREKGAYDTGNEFIYSFTGGLFSYQYAHAWYDLRQKKDKQGVDWFQNAIDATLGDRQFCIDHMDEYGTYGPNSWGIASMAFPRIVSPPQRELKKAGQLSEEYTMNFGPNPNGRGFALHDGTISPNGPAGCINFTPEFSIRSLRYLAKEHPQLWGPYGLTTSFNLNLQWWSRTTYGLDAGIILLALENWLSGFVWKTYMKNVWVQESMKKVEFVDYEKNYKLEMAELVANEKPIIQQQKAKSELLVEAFNNAKISGKGKYGTWDKDPQDTSQSCEMEISTDEKNGDEGASLKVTYDVDSDKPAFNGFWIKLPSKNYSAYTDVSFWIKGGSDGFPSRFKVELKGKAGTGAAYVSDLTDGWSQVIIPLRNFKGLKDYKDLTELVFVFEDQTVQKKTGSIYIDDISFETN